MNKTTYFAKAEDVQRQCYLINAENKILGRIATKAATILRGKHKRIYTPHLDTGDMVVIVNAGKIRVTGKKWTNKEYLRYTGYPGSLRRIPLEQLFRKNPAAVVRLAITRMIPKGPLGNRMKRKLRIYTGDKHPHQAQKSIPLEV